MEMLLRPIPCGVMGLRGYDLTRKLFMSNHYKPIIFTLVLLNLSACATVKETNYLMYTKRVQAQAFVTGKNLKPLPRVNPNIRRVSQKMQADCPKPIMINKVIYKPVCKARPNSTKKVIRRTVYRSKKAVARKVAAVRPVYRATPTRSKVQVRKAYIVPQRSHPKKRIQHTRPIARSKNVRRPVYLRPIARKPVSRTRPVVRKPYRAPVKPLVYRRAVTVVAVPVSQLNEALFSAAKGGNIQQMNQLLDQGAQVNAMNDNRETALHAAASRGRNRAVTLLLKQGANPNAITSNGWTPLHSAARFRQTQATKLLIRRGAQVNARNGQGKSALDLAQQMGAMATANALVQLGGR